MPEQNSGAGARRGAGKIGGISSPRFPLRSFVSFVVKGFGSDRSFLPRLRGALLPDQCHQC
jgi:hypothetical protein